MKAWWFVTAFVLATGTSAALAEKPTLEIINPIFLVQPNGQDFVNNYPEPAAAQSVEGSATLECFVELDTTTICRVTAEAPAGWGFGDAALDIADTFRVAPAEVNGVPTTGGRIRRTIRFVLPDDQPRNDWSELDRALFAVNPPLDLPSWDLAPNFYAVLDAYPPSARTNRIEGRGLLSCTVRQNRMLACDLVSERPRNVGFGPAALELSSQFRVATREAEFIARHRSVPFLLPIFFGSDPDEVPTSRYFTGFTPLQMPQMPVPIEAYPPAARAAGIEGRVIALCTLQQHPPAHCVVTEETPSGHGFAELVLAVLAAMPMSAQEDAMIVGDQIRYEFAFELP